MSKKNVMNIYILGASLSVLHSISLLVAAGSPNVSRNAVYLASHVQGVDTLRDNNFIFSIYELLKGIDPAAKTLERDVRLVQESIKALMHTDYSTRITPQELSKLKEIASGLPYLRPLPMLMKGNYLDPSNPNAQMSMEDAAAAAVALKYLQKYVSPEMAQAIDKALKEYTNKYGNVIEEPSAPPLEDPEFDAVVKELADLSRIVKDPKTYQTGWVSNKSYNAPRAEYWKRMVDLASKNNLDNAQRAELSKLRGTFAVNSWKAGDKQATNWINSPDINYSDYFKQVLGQENTYKQNPTDRFEDRMTEMNRFWEALGSSTKNSNVGLAFMRDGLQNLINIINERLPQESVKKINAALSTYAVREYLGANDKKQFDFSLKKLADNLTPDDIKVFVSKIEGLTNKNPMNTLMRYRDFATMMYQEYSSKYGPAEKQTPEQKDTLASLQGAKDRVAALIKERESNV